MKMEHNALEDKENLKQILKYNKSIKPANKAFNFDSGAFAARLLLAAFSFFRNTLTKFARQKLAGLSLAN
jgi:hypothetical protein